MKVYLLAVGERMPSWVESAFETYRKRLVAPVTLQLIEVAARRRGKNADITRIVEAEGEALLDAVPSGARPIVLDRNGRRIDTERLAAMLRGWVDESQDIAFLVGGPEGLSDRCIAAASLRLKLSDLTFPHPLVRVILAEQLYRAYSIIHGHPYHR
jgi:23S rRNA (pseudouridine1915-N3)-methyltransferase